MMNNLRGWHLSGDDIELEALTFIKMDGSSRIISFEPYPRDFEEFTIANIMVVNTMRSGDSSIRRT